MLNLLATVAVVIAVVGLKVYFGSGAALARADDRERLQIVRFTVALVGGGALIAAIFIADARFTALAVAASFVITGWALWATRREHE